MPESVIARAVMILTLGSLFVGVGAPAAGAGLESAAEGAQEVHGSDAARPEATPVIAMGQYPVEGYRDGASKLPGALVDALRRDLEVSGEEYLASADAAADAPRVVQWLVDRRVRVLSSELEETRLIVSVGSVEDFAAVRSAGAIPELGVDKAREVGHNGLRALADVRGGSGYTFVDGSQSYICSSGFNGRSIQSGASQLLTAGHCSGTAQRTLVQQRPGSGGQTGTPLGTPVSGSFSFGDGYDFGLVATASGLGAPPEILTWGGGAGAPMASAPLRVRDVIAATAGASACKSGSRTGWTCGKVLAVDSLEDVEGNGVNLIVTDLCMLGGDSGGAAVIGSSAIGISSAGTATTSCTAGSISGFFPMISRGGYESVRQAIGDVWEPSIRVETPVVTLPTAGGSIFQGRIMEGRVPSGSSGQVVRVYLDGSAVARTAPVSVMGAWQLSLAGLELGSHSFTVATTWGVHSRSATVSGNFMISALPTADRIGGTDRFDGGVKVSQRAYPATAPVVYVVSGQNFPDALSAGPAAVHEGGPLLLTLPGSLPPDVAAEIKRLAPKKIVVVGGTSSVSAEVVQQLGRLAKVIRVSGADRYATSLAVADYAFDSATSAYVATGVNFPDALSAGAAAGAAGVPVVLVFGRGDAVDAKTTTLMRSLGVTQVKIAGGTASVSNGVETSLRASFSAQRFAGTDRFDTSHLINIDRFPRSGAVFVANAYNFPDALTGSALAGKANSPLFIAPPDCMPARILDDIGRMGAIRVTLLGGEAVITQAAESLTPCRG